MLTYWSMYLGPAVLALARVRFSNGIWMLLGATMALLIGFRYEVGGDWGAYSSHFDRVAALSLSEVLNQWADPGYYLVNWASAVVGADVWLVNLVCGAIVAAGLVRFVRHLPDPLVAFTVAVPYMVIVVSMGYTRQAAAFGLMLWALVSLAERRQLAFVLTMAVAATFHKSAVVLLPLAAMAATERRIWTALWVGVFSAVLYVLILAERTDQLWDAYVTSDYAMASEGGPIRVAMNALPALLFLCLRNRFAMSREQRALWFWIALVSLGCIPLVFVAATAVDRVALYFMPIQLVVLSYLPQVFAVQQRQFMRMFIVGMYGLVLFVWLNFAAHRQAWLPYQFWPLAS